MRRPPRDPRGALISRTLALWSLLQGALALAVVAAIYFYCLSAGFAQDEVRAAAFLALVGINIGLVFVNRTFGASLRAALGRPNSSLWWGMGVTAMMLGIVLLWPMARDFFGLAIVPAQALWPSLFAGIVLLGGLQLIKLVYGRRLFA